MTKFFQFIDIFVTWQTIGWATKFYKIKESDTILDIGGYFGGFAVYAAKKVGPNGKVICFEPDPRNIAILEKRIRKLKLNNITLVKKALSNKVGKANLASNYSLSSIAGLSKSKKVFSVEISTLDREMRSLNIGKVDLLKMNIEGAELEAVDGATDALKNVKHIVIASHKRDGKATADLLKPILEKS
ncbi:FkbM family methyltransferase, partial [Patescibacteria group bacterium]|nr:FkbM family methyltransferase [Patescibacteria group bacterium]